MKITQDVRNYANGLSDNEKAALNLQAQEGMKDMSEKFKKAGSQIYLSEDGSTREAID